jgi:cold shock CspA family protein
LDALEKSYKANPRNAYVAIRLADHYKRQDNLPRAEEILKDALGAKPEERKLHYAYANLLIKRGGAKPELLLYHLKRSFNPGDANYDAQLLYARQLFIDGELDASKEVFKRLKDARVSTEIRDELNYPIEKTYTGAIARLEATYGFIARDGFNDWIYAHRSNMPDSAWKSLSLGARVSFKISFSMRSPNAFDIELL